MTERERAEAEVAEKERALTDAFEAPGGSWYDVPPSMVREGFADVAESGVNALKDLLIGATIGADPSTRTEPVWDQPMDWQELGEVGSLAMAPLAVGGRALLKRIARPLRAYHGSAADFDQFDLSHTGSGQGAQAYGHGLYFAEEPKVAHFYREDAAGPGEIERLRVGDKRVGPPNWDYSPRFYRGPGATMENIHSSLVEDLLIDESALLSHPGGVQEYALSRLDNMIDSYGSEWPEAVEAAQQLRRRLARPGAVQLKMSERPGHLYEVDLHVEPEQLLDWDASVAEQPERVREALGELRGSAALDYQKLPRDLDALLGGDAYRRLAQPDLSPAEIARLPMHERLPDEAVHRISSARLRDRDIPGLQYWDQGSRDAGRGSRNYVIWDPDVIDVRRKLAALLAVGGGAAAADAFDQTPVEFGR